MKANVLKRASVRALAIASAAACGWAQPAAAQSSAQTRQDAPQAAPSEEDIGADIVVTAEKREESRKDVPASVEVIGGEAITRTNAQSGFDLVKYLPGFGMDASAEIRTTTLKTRGVGTFTNSIGLQSSNLVAVDDEVLSRQSAMNGAIIELERVEALRGPQGTLFGENTSTGLIHYITKRPVIGRNEGALDLTVAQYDEMGARGMANVALGDNVALRLNASWSDAGGYIDNVGYPGNDIGKTRVWGLRGQALYESGAGFHALVRAEYSQTDTNCCAYVYLTEPTLNRYPALAIGNGVPTISTLNRLRPQPFDPDRPVASVSPGQFGRIDNLGISGEIGADLSPSVSLTYSGSYRNFTLENNTDTFNTPFPVSRYNFLNRETTRSVQQEVRLSSYGNSRFDWVAGLFYHDTRGDSIARNDRCSAGQGATAQPRVENGVLTGCYTAASETAFVNSYNATRTLNTSLLVPDRRLDRGFFDTHFENVAIFGQGTYKLSEKFDVTLGARLLRERSSAGFRLETYRPRPNGVGFDTLEDVVAAVAAGNTSLIRTPFVGTELDDSVSQFIYKAVLGYNLSDDVRIYANYSTGFKGVSYFITTNTDPADGNRLKTKPERSTNIELGLRSKLFGNRVTFNATVFDMSISDYQVRATRVVSELSAIFREAYVNAELARTRGFEIDATIRPTRNFSIYGSFAYFDANYEKFSDAPLTCPGGALASRCYTVSGVSLIDQSGLPFPNNSERQLYVSANYDIPVGSSGWEVSLRGDYRWESDRTRNITQIAGGLPASEGQGIADLYLGVHGEHVKVQMFVKNLFDTFYSTEDLISTLGEVRGFVPRDYKRYVGGSVSFSF